MDFLQVILTPFSWLLKVFCEFFNSYGIALILFTLIVKVILFPLTLKGKKSMIKMNLLSTQLREIQKRCGNDRDRYNREVQEFYAKNKVNPAGGCVWSLIPLFILIPLYAIIRRPFRYMMHLTKNQVSSVASAVNWQGVVGTEFGIGAYDELTLSSLLNADNLGAVQTATGLTGLFTINFMFFGLDLSQIPSLKFWEGGISWGSVGLFLMPLISAALSVLSMLVMQRTNQMNRGQDQNNPAAANNKSMLVIQPLISLWFGYTLPAGMCVYWIANSLFMMLQEVLAGKILRKDYEAAQRQMEEAARKAKEEEKERRRQAAERKAAAIAAGTYKKGKQSQNGPKEKGVDLSASREGIRAYARGRAYDPNRYPTTPYHDPDAQNQPAESEEPEGLTEEEKEILKENGIPIPQEPTAEQEVPAQENPEETPAAQETEETESNS